MRSSKHRQEIKNIYFSFSLQEKGTWLNYLTWALWITTHPNMLIFCTKVMQSISTTHAYIFHISQLTKEYHVKIISMLWSSFSHDFRAIESSQTVERHPKTQNKTKTRTTHKVTQHTRKKKCFGLRDISLLLSVTPLEHDQVKRGTILAELSSLDWQGTRPFVSTSHIQTRP
jgi:hypothetical protein